MLVLMLIEALPEESLTVALRRGGREFVGWNEDRAIWAGIYDALNVNTRATGHWKSKPPNIPEWKRPQADKAKKRPTTVKDLYVALGGERQG